MTYEIKCAFCGTGWLIDCFDDGCCPQCGLKVYYEEGHMPDNEELVRLSVAAERETNAKLRLELQQLQQRLEACNLA